MPFSSYPDKDDLERVIRSTGLFNATALDAAYLDLALETHAAAAVQQWENETGWIPFLRDALDVTRYFDPGGPNMRPQVVGGGYLLDPGVGIFSVTSINSGWTEEDAGTALVVNTDYRLTPYNAGVLSPTRPYTGIQLTVPSWGLRHSIRVIGKFGYSATVPEDAWLAISHQAVQLVLPEIATAVTGGMIEWKEADASERYGEAFLFGEKGAGAVWKLEWQRATNRYKRIVL